MNQLQKEVEEKGEVSITDPDIAHNVQTAVDSKYHLVVAIDVKGMSKGRFC